MTRVIHTGDTHLGYRQYHSPVRKQDFRDAFEQVITDAIESDVDAVVHAGDLFHDRMPDLEEIHSTISILRDLAAADIPFLAIVGNHERTRDHQWLDLFETLGLATRLGREPETIDDVAVYGLDFIPRSKRASLDYAFVPSECSQAVLVAHGAFAPVAPSVRNDAWELRSILEASPVDFDAVLLGDEHTPSTEQVDGTWVSYCGSTERTDSSEEADRGYNLVRFDEDVTIARRGLSTRSFEILDIGLNPGEGSDLVRERIRQRDIDDAVVIVRIHGDGDEVSAASIEEFACDHGALLARVTDHREIEEDVIDSVGFEDPDAAVRERLREMGLSSAALSIDETIRGELANSNIRDAVSEQIQELLADPDSFESAGTLLENESAQSGSDRSSDEHPTSDDSSSTDGIGDSTAGSDDGPEASTVLGTDDNHRDRSDGSEGDAASTASPDAEKDTENEQVTMNDFS